MATEVAAKRKVVVDDEPDKAPLTVRSIMLYAGVTIAGFAGLAYLGDHYFVTKEQGVEMAAEMKALAKEVSSVAGMVTEMKDEQRGRSSILLQHTEAFQRITLLIDSLEQRVNK